jgi:hypothetical protein
MLLGTLFLAVTGGYLSLSLLGSLESGPASPIAAAALLLLLLSQAWLFLVFFRSQSDEKLFFEKWMKRFAFYSMGLLSFLFTFSLMRDLLALPLRAIGQESVVYGGTASLSILVFALLGFGTGLWNAKFRLHTPEIEVMVPQLGKTELRIAHISDLHLGGGPEFSQVRTILKSLSSSTPHLIVLTGDIIDAQIDEIAQELHELSQLRAPLGVYFVLGNHECYWNGAEAIRALERCGIQTLLNEGRTLHHEGLNIFLAGVSDPAFRHFGGPGPVIPIAPLDAHLRILLAHQPQIASKTSELGYDLQLSGHTHGGQFFPWNLVVNRMYRHPWGLHRIQNLWIYVNQGTGYWGPPLRLGTRSELATLRVVGVSSSDSSPCSRQPCLPP